MANSKEAEQTQGEHIWYDRDRRKIEWQRQGVTTFHQIWDFMRMGCISPETIAKAILAGETGVKL